MMLTNELTWLQILFNCWSEAMAIPLEENSATQFHSLSCTTGEIEMPNQGWIRNNILKIKPQKETKKTKNCSVQHSTIHRRNEWLKTCMDPTPVDIILTIIRELPRPQSLLLENKWKRKRKIEIYLKSGWRARGW